MALTGPPGMAILGQSSPPLGKPWTPVRGRAASLPRGQFASSDRTPSLTVYPPIPAPSRGPLPWLQPCPAARGWEQDRPGPISRCSCCTGSQAPGQRLDGPQQARSVAVCRGGEVGRGEAGPLGSVPQRQALALTHGPGIGEWKEGRTHPGKGGARARCYVF